MVVLSGPGGVGKGTIAAMLIEADPRLWLSRSWTTRERRPGEAEDAYRYATHAEFQQHIDRDGFLEWAEFQGNRYGTPWPSPPVGKDVLLEIDVQGARTVRERDDTAVLIFVDAPSRQAQEERLRKRGDDEASVQRRISVAEEEAALARELDAIQVINDDLAACVQRLMGVVDGVRFERTRTAQGGNF